MLHCPAHATGYALGPEFHGHGRPTGEVEKGLLTMMERLLPNDAAVAKAQLQLTEYYNKSDSFSPEVNRGWTVVRETVAWKWLTFGTKTPELMHVAVRVLSLPCSTSSIERLWSIFGFIRSDRRNRLTVARSEKLAYVFANMQLLRGEQRKGGATPGNGVVPWQWEEMVEWDEEGLVVSDDE